MNKRMNTLLEEIRHRIAGDMVEARDLREAELTTGSPGDEKEVVKYLSQAERAAQRGDYTKAVSYIGDAADAMDFIAFSNSLEGLGRLSLAGPGLERAAEGALRSAVKLAEQGKFRAAWGKVGDFLDDLDLIAQTKVLDRALLEEIRDRVASDMTEAVKPNILHYTRRILIDGVVAHLQKSASGRNVKGHVEVTLQKGKLGVRFVRMTGTEAEVRAMAKFVLGSDYKLTVIGSQKEDWPPSSKRYTVEASYLLSDLDNYEAVGSVG